MILRALFALLLLHAEVADPPSLRRSFREALCEDSFRAVCGPEAGVCSVDFYAGEANRSAASCASTTRWSAEASGRPALLAAWPTPTASTTWPWEGATSLLREAS